MGAVGILGGQPDHMDALLQVLLVMNAAPENIDEQTDGEKRASAAFDVAASVSSEGVASSNSRTLTATSGTFPIGTEEKELASALISSAVVKAVVALGWQQDEVGIGEATRDAEERLAAGCAMKAQEEAAALAAEQAEVQQPVPYFTRPSVG